MNDFQREIYKTIDRLTEQKLRELGYDKTKRGKVISVYNTECIVQIDGEEYSCKLRRGIYVEPNDVVFVKFPQNNDIDKYVETVLGGNEIPENLIISAEEILAKLKTVDGEGSGLDADMLGGKHSSEYALKTDIIKVNYVHHQLNPLSEWIINHNLNKFPSITVVDSAGNVVLGDIRYVDENNVVLTFSSGFSGKAYFN